MTRNRRILISGAGIAGPTLAYWLLRRGFEPTLVERATAFREGGYIIDFWGVGYDVAERMGLLASLRARGYEMDDLRFVDARGRRRSGIGGDVLKRALGDRYFSIRRGDLALGIYETVRDRVETIFGDSVRSLVGGDDGVQVTFERNAPREFDLVVGADGLHSAVRAAANLGAEAAFERFLGYYCASFEVADYPHRDEHAYISFAVPGRQVTRYAVRDNRTAFLFVFAEPHWLVIASHDTRSQREVLRQRFGRDGWECPDILRRLDAADDLYFDAVSQIRLPAWSRGPVALIGDAAHCPSLLSGQGAAFGMAGAYLLAGELSRADGDNAVAFRAYESRFRPFIERKQRAAIAFAGSFTPKTRLGLCARDQALRLLAVPGLSTWWMRRTFEDRFELPDYDM